MSKIDLHQSTKDELVKHLQLPPPFPTFELASEDACDEWHSVSFPMWGCEMSADNVTTKHLYSLANDIHEMVATSDRKNPPPSCDYIDGKWTERENDPFLMMFDGLKSRSVWPQKFLIRDDMYAQSIDSEFWAIRVDIGVVD